MYYRSIYYHPMYCITVSPAGAGTALACGAGGDGGAALLPILVHRVQLQRLVDRE